MILAIFLTFFLLVLFAAILLFIFAILVPSLKNQNVDLENPMYSTSEVNFTTVTATNLIEPTGMKAVVLCSANKKFDTKRFNYKGQRDCNLFSAYFDTENDCTGGCVGFGSCIDACSRKAISIVNGCAQVSKLCNGCGECVSSCPKKLIKLIPAETKEYVLCSLFQTQKTTCNSMLKSDKIPDRKIPFFNFYKKLNRIFSK